MIWAKSLVFFHPHLPIPSLEGLNPLACSSFPHPCLFHLLFVPKMLLFSPFTHDCPIEEEQQCLEAMQGWLRTCVFKGVKTRIKLRFMAFSSSTLLIRIRIVCY